MTLKVKKKHNTVIGAPLRPNIEPCGIPLNTFAQHENLPLTLTLCLRSVKIFWSILLSVYKLLLSNRLCGTLSKTFSKSVYTTSILPPDSNVSVQSSSWHARCDVVRWRAVRCWDSRVGLWEASVRRVTLVDLLPSRSASPASCRDRRPHAAMPDHPPCLPPLSFPPSSEQSLQSMTAVFILLIVIYFGRGFPFSPFPSSLSYLPSLLSPLEVCPHVARLGFWAEPGRRTYFGAF